MKEVVFEVIISIIILALLVVVINVFRGNLDIIGSSSQKTEGTEKIKTDDMALAGKRAEVSGSDVISVIRYYSKDSNVTVTINGVKKTETDIKTLTSDTSFYEKKFDAKYSDDGKEIKYTQK